MNPALLTIFLWVGTFFEDAICTGIEYDRLFLSHLKSRKFENERLAFSGSRSAVIKENKGYSTSKIETTSGPVVGVTTSDSHTFYQVPYAEPPVGPSRWRDPVPIRTPFDEINATVNNPVRCYQDPEPHADRDEESEDCLVLNVFVPLTVSLPVNDTAKALPVMFYIHGGSFKIGSGTDSSLDGRELSRVTNTVIVTINYRLGALGFLTLEEEGQEYIEGNQGLKDQRLALEWVQDNIGNFGGDKNRVTIFGNSAGAQSVMLHVVSSKSKDLFRAAIQQSNPSIYSFYYPTPEGALRISRRLIEDLQCNGTDKAERICLMETSPRDIVRAQDEVETATSIAEDASVYSEETFFPIIDGEDIIDLPINLFKSGKWSKDKSMIIGVNTEESMDWPFYFPEGTVLDKEALLGLNTALFGPEYSTIITEKYVNDFPPQEGQDYRFAFAHEMSNYYFDCPSRLMARYASDVDGNGAIYFYANSHPVLLDVCVARQDGNTTGCKFAYHASEIRYVFRTLLESQELTEADGVIADEFSTYWGSFARTELTSENLESPLGNFTHWPKYQNVATNDVQSWSHMEITAPSSNVEHAYKEDICDFWDSINYAVATASTTTAGPITAVDETTSAGTMAQLLTWSIWSSLTAVVTWYIFLS